MTRRQLIQHGGHALVAMGVAPFARAASAFEETPPEKRALRSVNIVNFIRAVEPRGPMDLMLPVQKQMEILLKLGLPGTWLLQFDALVSGPFVDYLREKMPAGHEVGIWFEMNEMHCRAAGVNWRGRPGYEWDHYPSVAFTIGYSPEERIKLADAFMSEFKKVFGRYPKSVASWNLDSITMAHLSDRYGVDAFAVCRDQIATDGFTIWGAPIAGYYPSKTNCWSPALDRKNQIHTPVFRMLGQDPVYYYERSYPLQGKRHTTPDTMEPVWPSGRSTTFIKNFLAMIEDAPTMEFAYAQLGQENSFGWPSMEPAYERQMAALVGMRDRNRVHIETMGETGRRFKSAFRETPPQAQVMLDDPFGNAKSEGSIWYQSRFYRANLHLKGGTVYLRDLTVYADQHPQPFLKEATKLNDVEQRMPAVVDGYHWSSTPGSEEPGSAGFLAVDGRRVRVTGKPRVLEQGKGMRLDIPIEGGKTLTATFLERELTLSVLPNNGSAMELSFEWDPTRAPLSAVQSDRVNYHSDGLDYSVLVSGPKATAKGWSVAAKRGTIKLTLSQPSPKG